LLRQILKRALTIERALANHVVVIECPDKQEADDEDDNPPLHTVKNSPSDGFLEIVEIHR